MLLRSRDVARARALPRRRAARLSSSTRSPTAASSRTRSRGSRSGSAPPTSPPPSVVRTTAAGNFEAGRRPPASRSPPGDSAAKPRAVGAAFSESSSPSRAQSSAPIRGRSRIPRTPKASSARSSAPPTGEWDLGLLRAAAVLAARRLVSRPGSAPAALARLRPVILLLAVPATLLQVGLRDATHPWYHVNDSTYQIDLAGELVLDGGTPYGHDYRGSGSSGGTPRSTPTRTSPASPSTTSRISPGRR